MQITPEQMASWNAEQRHRAIDWARANGLNENDVSATKPIEIGEGAILYHRFVRNDRGKVQLRPDSPDEIWTEPEIARLIVMPPPGL